MRGAVQDVVTTLQRLQRRSWHGTAIVRLPRRLARRPVERLRERAASEGLEGAEMMPKGSAARSTTLKEERPLPAPPAPPQAMSDAALESVRMSKERRRQDNRLGIAILPDTLKSIVEASIDVCDKNLLRQDALNLYARLRQGSEAIRRKRSPRQPVDEEDLEEDLEPSTSDLTPGQMILEERREARRAVKAAEREARRQSKLNERRAIKGTKAGGVILTRRDVLTHVAAEMPGHFAAIASVLSAIQGRLHGQWQPKNVLEYGSRAGAGLWALRSSFEADTPQYTGIDASEAMLRGAEALTSRDVSFFKDRRFREMPESGEEAECSTVPLEKPSSPGAQSVEFLRLSPDLLFAPSNRPDLVMSNYFLSTLASVPVRERALRRMWANTGEMMVVVERGTPRGFELIEEARRFLLSLGVQNDDGGRDVVGNHVVAPCPHAFECPMRSLSKDFCHFSQRLQTPSFLRKTRHSKAGEEDIKYSYIAIRRGPERQEDKSLVQSTWGRFFPEARVMTPPLKRSGHVLLDLCVPNGQLERHTITKSQGKEIYAQARKSRWGDRTEWAGKRLEIRSRGLQRLEKVPKIEAEGEGEGNGSSERELPAELMDLIGGVDGMPRRH